MTEGVMEIHAGADRTIAEVLVKARPPRPLMMCGDLAPTVAVHDTERDGSRQGDYKRNCKIVDDDCDLLVAIVMC